MEGSTDLIVVRATKKQLENKSIMVDRLGKVWKVINVVKSVGEAVSDVSLTLLY